MNSEYSELKEDSQVLRQCPDCRRYVHMSFLSVQQCEHCGLITDFTHFTTPEQKLWDLLKYLARSCGSIVERYITVPQLSMIGIGKLSRISLMVALPVLLFWLFAFNTIDTSAWKVQHNKSPSNPSTVNDFIDF